ncbi:MAG: hypothetical protein DRI24_24410 [Deltaproteobacteria bacterium]|nr:MAG: hypothetical protein DRI24_24410 [Deltaproteobacteria bacterium]
MAEVAFVAGVVVLAAYNVEAVPESAYLDEPQGRSHDQPGHQKQTYHHREYFRPAPDRARQIGGKFVQEIHENLSGKLIGE